MLGKALLAKQLKKIQQWKILQRILCQIHQLVLNVQAKELTLQPVPTRVHQKRHVPARLAVLKQLLQRKQKHHLIPIPLFNRIKL